MKKETMCEVWTKPMETVMGGNPLLLFVTYGHDKEKDMFFVRINGIRNPLPFNEAYGIKHLYLESWLKSHGWKKVGHRNMYDL